MAAMVMVVVAMVVVATTTATLSLKSVPAGVYLLRVTDTEGREYHRKIVKK